MKRAQRLHGLLVFVPFSILKHFCGFANPQVHIGKQRRAYHKKQRMPATEEDLRHMRRALELAEQAHGRTGDNPWVGCVLVKDGKMLGEGYTHPPGQDHAEAAALREAEACNHELRGATLYCTLEPCSFHGRTPSCAQLLVRKGIARVLVALRDPHPKVNGAGLEILRDGGVAVEEGLLAEDVARQLQPWLTRPLDSHG